MAKATITTSTELRARASAAQRAAFTRFRFGPAWLPPKQVQNKTASHKSWPPSSPIRGY